MPLNPYGGRRHLDDGRRSVLAAVASTVLFFAVAGWIVVTSPGWPEIQRSFLDGEIFWDTLGDAAPAFVARNVVLALAAEALILVLALVVAVLRSLPGPVFAPLRLIATVYVDLFRAVPGIVVIFALGFGAPTLDIPWLPVDEFFWAVVTLTLLYSAYVSEVYRAGIDSVHPSQEAAARSLGLTRWQAMRFVVLPQAVRRVIPPLLNDFIGLQKDTVLVSFIGVIEVFRTAQIKQAATFNFTPYVAVTLIFLVVTIPMARFVDWLIARERDKRYAALVRANAKAARRGRIWGFR
ncbi:MAG TPA: amino acid ABC transporter permease [Candidatus Limnocylindrales bacterium]|nr:amino acid ABC transporter permease [Candidatus Limnocylindrales bacterium]